LRNHLDFYSGPTAQKQFPKEQKVKIHLTTVQKTDVVFGKQIICVGVGEKLIFWPAKI